jgi:hypothetical protein
MSYPPWVSVKETRQASGLRVFVVGNSDPPQLARLAVRRDGGLAVLVHDVELADVDAHVELNGWNVRRGLLEVELEVDTGVRHGLDLGRAGCLELLVSGKRSPDSACRRSALEIATLFSSSRSNLFRCLEWN